MKPTSKTKNQPGLGKEEQIVDGLGNEEQIVGGLGKEEQIIEEVAEDIVKLLPEVGKIASVVLPGIGLALAPVSPEAAIILPIVGRFAPFAFNLLSEIIKVGINIFEDLNQDAQKENKGNDNIDEPNTNTIINNILDVLEKDKTISSTILNNILQTALSDNIKSNVNDNNVEHSLQKTNLLDKDQVKLKNESFKEKFCSIKNPVNESKQALCEDDIDLVRTPQAAY